MIINILFATIKHKVSGEIVWAEAVRNHYMFVMPQIGGDSVFYNEFYETYKDLSYEAKDLVEFDNDLFEFEFVEKEVQID